MTIFMWKNIYLQVPIDASSYETICVNASSPLMTPQNMHIDGLVQDCNISNVLAEEILQSCTKPSI